MYIVVTGASGFIGRYVVSELLDRGHRVGVVTRNSENLDSFTWKDKVSVLIHDFNKDNEDCFTVWGKPDAIIHLAWQGLPNYKENFHLTRNLPNDLRFLSSLMKKGLKNLTVTGTCFEYGLLNGELEEDSPVDPVLPYAIAKDSLRKALVNNARAENVSLKWLRLFYMFGEGQSSRSIIELLKADVKAGKDKFNMSLGEQIRDYSPVERMASYIVSCALQDEVQGVVNCCSGEPVSLRRFMEANIKENGYDISLNLGYYPYVDYEPLAFWGSRKKLNTVLAGESR